MQKKERWRLEAEAELEAMGGVLPEGLLCGEEKRRHNGGGRCVRPAGWQTNHLGVGRCSTHGGGSKHENTKGAWILAHEIARALNVSPWEALLGEVRRTAGMVAWLDAKVAEAPNDDSLLDMTRPSTDRETGESIPGGYGRWVEMRDKQRQHLARVSKMALDAGVAQQMVTQFALQGEAVAQLMLRVLVGLSLDEDRMALATSMMRSELLALEATLTAEKVIEGEEVRITRE